MTKHRLLVLLVTGLAAASVAACDPGDVGIDQGKGTATPTTTDADAAKPGSDAGFAAIPEIVRGVEPSVVAILTGTGEGSGVVWRSDGLVLTNAHVVENASTVQVAFADGRRSPAEVVAADPLTDLALLRTERRNLPAATFSDKLPAVGELAVAIGNPLGSRTPSPPASSPASTGRSLVPRPRPRRSSISSRPTRPSLPGIPAERWSAATPGSSVSTSRTSHRRPGRCRSVSPSPPRPSPTWPPSSSSRAPSVTRSSVSSPPR